MTLHIRDRDAAGQLDRVRRVLTARFHSESAVAEVTHLLLPLAAMGVLWGSISSRFLCVWIALILGLTLARSIQRILATRRAEALDHVPGALRVTVVAAALCWGAGVMFMAPRLPMAELALIMVVLSGIAAGATSTLVSDAPVFYGFLVSILGPLVVGILFAGRDRLHVIASLFVMVFAGTMATLFRRNRSTLLNYLSTSDTLEQNNVAEHAERLRAERRFSVRNAVTQVLAESTLDHPVVPAILRTMCEHLGWEAGAAWRAAPGTDQLRCSGVWRANGVEADDFLEITGATGLALESSWLGRACSSHHGVWIANGDIALEGARAEAAKRAGIHTAVAIPLRDGATLVGALELFRTREHEPDPETLAVFGALGNQVGTAIGRRRAEIALRAAELQNRQLVEASSDMVWRVDPEGRWTFVNRAAEQIYKMSPESLLGHYMIERCAPASIAADRSAFERVLRGEDLRDYESVHLDAEGLPHTISTSVRPILDSEGRLVSIEGIARDVSERAAARDALREARDAAERATAAKSAFLANMSHEIRTPMNGILGMTELLLDTALTPDQQRCAEVISTSGENLLAIINDILDLSKIDAQQLDLEATEFDLHALVEGTAKLFIPAAAQRTVELITDMTDSVPRRVIGDPTRLRQILTNLVGNAVKFTHGGEVAIVLDTENVGAESRIRFGVRDSGIGIAPDAVAAIFEPFRQADATTTRKYGGTGLGLSISRHLVELMGGRLEVDSTVGVGSEFHFAIALPLATAPEPEAVSGADLRDVRILLVDDNAANRRVVGGMLSRAGCIVDDVAGGDEALRALRKATSRNVPYRMLVSDVNMPGMDGFELAAAVRADPVFREIRIMLLASADRRGDPKRCDHLGVGAYLLKPIARDELLHAVAATLGSETTPLLTRTSIRESRRSLYVLLAEDNVVNQEVAAMMLRRRGHIVHVVKNGREALEAVQRRAYDVVLMDMQMPEMDGLQATRAIRALPAGGAVPIVALTASAIAGERERCIAAGMDDYLSKPFKPLELFAMIEGHVPAADDAVDVAPKLVPGVAPVPPALSDADELPVDLAGFRADLRGGGVEEIADELLGLFTEDVPVRLAAIEAANLSDDPEEIARAAHAFKSAASAIRAIRLSALLQQMETAGRRADAGSAKALLPAIREQCERTLGYLAEAAAQAATMEAGVV